MINAEFTPGPWVWMTKDGNAFLVPEKTFKSDPDFANLEAIVDDGSAYGEYSNTIDYRSANAKLIAAAPDLYEALANLENDAGQIPEHAWNMVQAALAKARGES